MSSPIAKNIKSHLDNILIDFHRRSSHAHRVSILAKEIIARLPKTPSGASIRYLDVGCGDMTLADVIQEMDSRVHISCADIHPCPDELRRTDPRWERYVQFDGVKLPFLEGSFDIVSFIDVLHHVDPEAQIGLLQSAARAGHTIFIKDHFEYGAWSRCLLRMMDFLGNFAYGVTVPRRYFTIASFKSLCQNSGLVLKKCDIGLDIYSHLPLIRLILRQKWQFMAVCVSK